MTHIKRTLTIAGNDASGGAGLAADLKTFTEYGCFGQVAVTTLVSMDPEKGWAHHVFPIELAVVEQQLTTVLASDQPLAAVKTGMIGTVDLVKLVSQTIRKHQLKNVVIDPVLVCKGEDEVLNPETADALREDLVPLADVVTPNLFEAAVLAQMPPLKTLENIKAAAVIIHQSGAKHVVIKGGKSLDETQAIDVYYDGKDFELLTTDKIFHGYNHGAGCTFAAAITAGLANDMPVKEAIYAAKNFVTAAIKDGFPYNQFVGSVYHSAARLTE